jgi:hypothetical protein
MLVVDEPALEAFGTRRVEEVWDPLRAVAPTWGLHLCCRVPWELVDRAEPDLLSFDLALGGVDERAAETLRRLAARGGRIAWGVLAAHRAEGCEDAIARLAPALERVGACGERSVLTASCGTGRTSVARETAVAAALGEAAQRMRSRRSCLRRLLANPCRDRGLRIEPGETAVEPARNPPARAAE